MSWKLSRGLLGQIGVLGAVAGCTPTGPRPVGPVASCPAPARSSSGAPPVASLIGDPSCPVWGCGANSPTLADGVVFDELDSTGLLEDEHGIKIARTVLRGEPITLRVVGDLLSATRHDAAATPLSDRELMEMTITLDTRVGPFELQITDINKQALTFWAGPRDPVPAYQIMVSHAGQKVPLCRQVTSSVDPEWRREIDFHAIVFAGDRYNARAKTVSASPGTTWFNLACAGTATAKMHLMRHTEAGGATRGGAAPFATTLAQRQAMLKMFVADYCGTGDAFTVDGQPLRYRDAKRWYPNTAGIEPLDPRGVDRAHPFAGTIEALWDEHGPVCLDVPRRERLDEVRAACTSLGRSLPPPCGGAAGVLAWWDHPDVPVPSPDPAHPLRTPHVISANAPCPPAP